jgi:hypothetical protein
MAGADTRTIALHLLRVPEHKKAKHLQTSVDLPDALCQKSESPAASRGATVEQFIVEAVAKEVQGEFASRASGPRLPKVRFDGMRDRIELPPGWDDPIDLDRFLMGDLYGRSVNGYLPSGRLTYQLQVSQPEAMSDIQILTIALAIIVPLSLLIYSNSRVTDVKEVLRAEMHSQNAELRLPIERNHSETMLKLAGMDGRLTRIENAIRTP